MKNERKELKVNVLIVDDEELARRSNQLSVMNLLQKLELSADDVGVSLAADIKDALSILRQQTVHVVLLDRDLGTSNGQQIDGVDYIQDILDIQPSTQILVVTGHNDTRLAVRSMKLGACGYIVKSSDKDYLEYRNTQIMQALKRAKTEIRRTKEKLLNNKGIYGKYICKSKAMQSIEIQLKTLAQYSAPVLFLGKSGLGKTITAKRLNHLRAEFLNQKDRTFFNINMANIPKDLSDSILFGHEKGAFTGAHAAKQGLFELANGGDLFLDEIGEASLEVQAKLLKVIEEKEFCRVGGNKNFKTNARVILATNRDLQEMVNQKEFREDLYARICTFDITLPSLEERKEDIPYICEAIIGDMMKENKNVEFSYEDFPEPLKEYLQRDNIPFNIRGVRNDIERLMIHSKQDNSGRLDFSSWKSVLGVSRRSVFHSKVPTEYISYSDFEKLPTNFLSGQDFPGIKMAKSLLERKLLQEAVSKSQTKKRVAQLLKISESNALSKMDKYNISTADDRPPA